MTTGDLHHTYPFPGTFKGQQFPKVKRRKLFIDNKLSGKWEAIKNEIEFWASTFPLVNGEGKAGRSRKS